LSPRQPAWYLAALAAGYEAEEQGEHGFYSVRHPVSGLWLTDCDASGYHVLTGCYVSGAGGPSFSSVEDAFAWGAVSIPGPTP
jgi:hypothetical protein